MSRSRHLGIASKIVIALAVVATVPLVMVGLYSVSVTEKALVKVAVRDIDSQVRHETAEIEDYLKVVSQNTLFLSGVPPIQGIIRARDGNGYDEQGHSSYETWVSRLQAIFSGFGGAKPYYQQFRYLDEDGNEMVRVDILNGVPRAVARGRLQNKADTAHFRDTMKLSPDKVFVSDIDLNVEYGRIERPLVPVIRFGVPIFDPQNRRRGIVVINISGSAVFEALQDSEHVRHYITNSDGSYSLHPDQSKRWGVQLGHGYTIDQEFPESSGLLSGPAFGRIDDLAGNLLAHGVVYPDATDRTRYWKIISAVPRAHVLSEIKRFQLVVGVLIVIALVIAIGIGFWLSRRWMIGPILDLAAVMKRVGQGQISERASVRSGDEIGQLTEAFNAMARSLQDGQEHLETRVEERTRELSAEIAERQRIEDALREAKREAETANRAKSEFLSSMSHELRTPMNAILGFSEILKDEMFGPIGSDQYREYAEDIHQSGAHLLELISQVLDLAKIEAGKVVLTIENLAPKPLLEDCLTIARTLADKRDIECIYLPPASALPMIRADATRFKQVLLNLLSNAVKYNKDGGTVCLEYAATADRMLRLSVSDTGPGIPTADRRKLFEPFSRLKAESAKIEGTGIGLTISKQLVELMGGRIDFESKVGRGSTFWIEVPLAEDAAAKNVGPPNAERAPNRRDIEQVQARVA